jgi:DNA polymerase I-like protein with 3'-5' exonuclease and polymerase domains
MAATILSEPPAPFSCSFCEQVDMLAKEGPACERCPSLKGSHYFPNGDGFPGPDVLFLGDVPDPPPRIRLMQWNTTGAEQPHPAFECDGGRVVRNAVAKLKRNPAWTAMHCRYAYAVKCAVGVPNKATISACGTPLDAELERIVRARALDQSLGPLVVVAHGVVALRALGIAVHSFEEAAGRVYELNRGSLALVVIATMSLKAIGVAVGKYSSLLADIERAFRAVRNESIQVRPREELEKEYSYPTTIAEVRDLTSMIARFSEDLTPAASWAISVDSETNSLLPHKDGLKLLMVSASWLAGKSCAIPLWHAETAYDPAQAWPYVRDLLIGPKPKILHNAKFDLKVFWKSGADLANVSWDVMLAEHLLEEDKKGQYSLKYLVKQFLPQYAGYEDQLQDILESLDADAQAQGLRKQLAESDAPLPVPEAVRAALALLKLGERFRASSLQKKIADWETKGEKKAAEVSAAKLLLAAQEAGEFKTRKLVHRKKKDEGGYERIPLKDLLFYAAVDADVTRQLAIKQRNRMAAEAEGMAMDRRSMVGRQKNDPSIAGYSIERIGPEDEPFRSLLRRQTIPTMRALADMEFRGIKVDRSYMHEAEVRLQLVIQDTERQIYEMAGEAFNINSGTQLGRFLFSSGKGFRHPNAERAAEMVARDGARAKWDGDRMRYEPVSYTERGALQTTEAVLKSFVARYGCPLSDAVLLYRKASKAKGTFLNNVDKLSLADGMMHTSYNQTGTNSGRLSSSRLNMQNTPKGSMGKIPDSDPRAKTMSADARSGVKCKRLFIPDDTEGMVFANCDAKGAEIVVLSGYAQDAALIESLLAGQDTHCFFSSKILNPAVISAGLQGEDRRIALEKAGIDESHGWTYEDFLLGKEGLHEDKAYGSRLKKLRDNVKRVVFGTLYGARAKKISEIAGIPVAQAQAIIDTMFTLFPTLPRFIDQTCWELENFGHVETYFGRRRRFALRHRPPKKLLEQAKRRAVNFKIQSTSSEIVLDTLATIAPIVERDLGGRLLLTVHDSIGMQVPRKYAGQVPDLITKYGTTRVAGLCPWLPVPYRWDVEMGPSYGDLSPAKGFLDALSTQLQLEDEHQGYVEEELFDDLRGAVLEKESA